MKKMIALLMVLGLAVSSFSAIGCDSGSKTEVKKTTTTETPEKDVETETTTTKEKTVDEK